MKNTASTQSFIVSQHPGSSDSFILFNLQCLCPYGCATSYHFTDLLLPVKKNEPPVSGGGIAVYFHYNNKGTWEGKTKAEICLFKTNCLIFNCIYSMTHPKQATVISSHWDCSHNRRILPSFERISVTLAIWVSLTDELHQTGKSVIF